MALIFIVYYLGPWAFVMQGAVMVPHYNSRATVVVFVVEGTGRFEMACPHLSSQSQEHQGKREEEEEEESSGKFQRVSARLSPGDAFVIPAGHPISVVASERENLRLVGFGINGHDNRRNFLAGNRSSQLTFSKQTKVWNFNYSVFFVSSWCRARQHNKPAGERSEGACLQPATRRHRADIRKPEGILFRAKGKAEPAGEGERPPIGINFELGRFLLSMRRMDREMHVLCT